MLPVSLFHAFLYIFGNLTMHSTFFILITLYLKYFSIENIKSLPLEHLSFLSQTRSFLSLIFLLTLEPNTFFNLGALNFLITLKKI